MSTSFAQSVSRVISDGHGSSTLQPDIVALANGNSVVAWTTTSSNPSNSEIVIVLLDPAGNEIRRISLVGNEAEQPGLAASPDGGFVVSWTGGPTTDVFVQRYGADGVAVSGIIQVNPLDAPGANTAQFDGDISVLKSGEIVAVYRDGSDVFVQGFTATGVKLGGPVLAHASPVGNQATPAVTALADGGFVVLWGDDLSTGNAQSVQIGRKFDANFNPVGDQFRVSPETDAYFATIAPVSSGGFVAFWFTNGEGSWGARVKGQIFSASGDKIGTEFLLPEPAKDRQQYIANVAATADGGFVVTWADWGKTDPASERIDSVIKAQVFGNDGTPLSSTFVVSGPAEGLIHVPEVTVLANGNLEFVWTEPGSITRVMQFASSIISGTNGDDILVGSDAVNTITGLGGNDVLIGGRGADALDGGPGTDTVSYAEDYGAVFVNLTLRKGYTNASFGDTYTSIENVIGTSYNDFIIGDTGVNRLDGGAGNDTIIGAIGGDVLIEGNGIDTASYEDNSGTVFVNLTLNAGSNNAAQGDTYSGIENLKGGLFDDFFIGDEGNNQLDGAMGADNLLGAGGADTFVFAYAPGAASGFDHPNSHANIDTILDFTTGVDKIELSQSAFSALGLGQLDASAFVTGTAAQDADDRIIYDAATGKIYYDADGSGSGAAVLFAVLDNKAPLAATDFVIAP